MIRELKRIQESRENLITRFRNLNLFCYFLGSPTSSILTQSCSMELITREMCSTSQCKDKAERIDTNWKTESALILAPLPSQLSDLSSFSFLVILLVEYQFKIIFGLSWKLSYSPAMISDDLVQIWKLSFSFHSSLFSSFLRPFFHRLWVMVNRLWVW